MRVGLSYSRCVRDIVDGVVDIEDVLVIISRTNFDPRIDEQWKGIWHGYRQRSGWSNPEWMGYPETDEGKFREVSITLLEQGKLHQPRQFGMHPHRMPYIWLETVLPSEELETNPVAQAAWNNFQVIAGLTGVSLDKEAQ